MARTNWDSLAVGIDQNVGKKTSTTFTIKGIIYEGLFSSQDLASHHDIRWNINGWLKSEKEGRNENNFVLAFFGVFLSN